MQNNLWHFWLTNPWRNDRVSGEREQTQHQAFDHYNYDMTTIALKSVICNHLFAMVIQND